ncbi:MAG: ATP-binding protein [Ignavibacteria bacterium]|nr:ATP-binding protein [Ignavibacteria bacterium]
MSDSYISQNDATEENVLILPSDTRRIVEIEPFLTSIDCCRFLTKTQRFNMFIAVTEAVSNAMTHAHKSDYSKNVTIRVRCLHEGMAVSVKDSGKGFPIADVPDPRDGDNILRTYGRGVFLIKELATDVDFSITPHGTTVTMFFSRS